MDLTAVGTLFLASQAANCQCSVGRLTGVRLLETEKSAKLLREHASEAPDELAVNFADKGKPLMVFDGERGELSFMVFSGNIRITM